MPRFFEVLVIAEKCTVSHTGLALGKASPYAPSDVVADASALLLGKGCKQRQEKFSIFGHGINVLTLEADGDPLLFQPSRFLVLVPLIPSSA